MTAPRFGALLAAALTAIAAAGCGGGGGRATTAAQPRTTGTASTPGTTAPGQTTPPPGAPTIPTPAPTGLPADPAAVKVIQAWSTALRRGDVNRAASYFALPSEFINGSDATGGVPVITIQTRAEAVAVNATLPCGAAFISADQRGRYVNALFRLTNRPGLGGGCGSGAGLLARTNFVIAHDRIVRWIRAPDEPGDSQRAKPPSGPQPPAPGSGGPVA